MTLQKITVTLLWLLMVPLAISTKNSYVNTTYAENNRTNTSRHLTDPCQENTDEARNIFFIVLLVSIFIIAVIGNSFAIIVIALSNTLRRSPTNVFIASLAATDLGVAFFTVPIRLDTYLHSQSFCFNIHVCRMFNTTDLIFHVGSVAHLFLIAVERFIAIWKPFLHQRIMTKQTTILCVVLTWTYACIWAGLGAFNWSDPSVANMVLRRERDGMVICLNRNGYYFTAVYIVSYIVPLFIMGVLYTVILKIALRQARVIASLNPAYLSKLENGKVVRNKHEMRATRTLAIVYGAFVICWLPVTIITLTSYWCVTCFTDFRRDHESLFKFVILLFVETLPPINSCLNPFVYILANKQFRRAFQNLLYKILQRPRYVIDINESTVNKPSASRKRLTETSNVKYVKEKYELRENEVLSKENTST